MSHSPTIVSLHVGARSLLTTVAGRSSMDRMTEGIEPMVIETLLFVLFVVIVGAAVVKAYRVAPGCSGRPVHEGASIKNRGPDDSHQLHPRIAPNPRRHNGAAFMHGHHPETHNYRSACARTGLAASRRPSLVI